MFDYLEFKPQIQLTSEYKSLVHRFYQTIPTNEQTYRYMNFFEHFFLRTIQDQTNFYRSLINRIFHFESLINLQNYLFKRYPNISFIKPNRLPIKINNETTTSSKVHIHEILNLFDPNLKPKAVPLPPINQPPFIPRKKPSLTLKKLSTRITSISAFSNKKRPSLTTTRIK